MLQRKEKSLLLVYLYFKLRATNVCTLIRLIFARLNFASSKN